jgi:hypothetical protein
MLPVPSVRIRCRLVKPSPKEERAAATSPQALGRNVPPPAQRGMGEESDAPKRVTNFSKPSL